MDENTSISIAQALNHIQSWLNTGEFEKVVQGCTEILEIEPGNQRALALMKIAEERRVEHLKEQAASSPKLPKENHETVEPSPLPSSTTPEHPPIEEQQRPLDRPFMRKAEALDKGKLFLAMLIPAIMVVLLGGGLIWFLANRDREETIADNSSDNGYSLSTDTAYLKDNEERVKDLTEMGKIIENYKIANGEYPSVDEIEAILVKSSELSDVPRDPKQGKTDAEGKTFGYVYAVYDSKFDKENQYYILSALFEDSQGVGSPWNLGESIKNYEDYRDIAEENVVFIGEAK